MPSHDSARDVLAPPPAPAGSSHLKSSLGRTAAKCRTPTTVFPDDLDSVNVIATDLSAGSEPPGLWTGLFFIGSRSGGPKPAGAAPGRGRPGPLPPPSPPPPPLFSPAFLTFPRPQ